MLSPKSVRNGWPSCKLMRVSLRRFDSTSRPADQAVLVEDRRDQLAARRQRRVVRIAGVLERARLAAAGVLGAEAVHRQARLADAGAQLDAAAAAEPVRPFAVQAGQRRAAARRRLGAVVGCRRGADGLRQRAVALRAEAVVDQDRRERRRVDAVFAAPLHARRRMQAAAAARARGRRRVWSSVTLPSSRRRSTVVVVLLLSRS